jgi:hypothetical protein
MSGVIGGEGAPTCTSHATQQHLSMSVGADRSQQHSSRSAYSHVYEPRRAPLQHLRYPHSPIPSRRGHSTSVTWLLLAYTLGHRAVEGVEA